MSSHTCTDCILNRTDLVDNSVIQISLLFFPQKGLWAFRYVNIFPFVRYRWFASPTKQKKVCSHNLHKNGS